MTNPARVVRKFNGWDILLYSGIKTQDRIMLLMFVSDWLKHKKPITYKARWLRTQYGISDYGCRAILGRLTDGGWIWYQSNKGKGVYGITVVITTNTIKTFKLPRPVIDYIDPESPEYVKFLAKQARRHTSFNSITRNPSFKGHLLNDTHEKERIKKKIETKSNGNGVIPVSPNEQVRLLIEYFDDFLTKMSYTESKKYTAEQAILDAEKMIGERGLQEWQACIDWVRHVKKALVRDDWIYKLKVYKLITVRTAWNHYRDAREQGRVVRGKDSRLSVYDQRRK